MSWTLRRKRRNLYQMYSVMEHASSTTTNHRIGIPALPGWAILPLRLFLGISFLAAGFDKLSDPAFLDPNARDYIGHQIANFAPGTPLEGFLLNFATPNADLFGLMVMGGELCIAVAVLLGLLTRFSAFMGMLLNLTFYLSVTWDVRPFYFGADLPYAVAWLTLMLAGPGPFALDSVLGRWLNAQPEVMSNAPQVATGIMTRRTFLGLGAAGLAGAMLASTGLAWGVLHPRRVEALVPATPTVTPEVKGSTTPEPEQPAATPTAPATDQAATRQLVAASGALSAGQALEFSLPTGEPAVLVHNDTGYSAYIAICTHRRCTVHPNPSTGLLKCPCHGAQFDPKAKGQVVRGPALLPLTSIPLVVEADGSVYLEG